MAFPDLLLAADRAILQNVGGSVRYASGVGAIADVDGVFDAAYVRQVAGTPGVMSAGPAVFLRVADLTSDPEEDSAASVTIGGTNYTIREVKKDGLGGVVLLLSLG